MADIIWIFGIAFIVMSAISIVVVSLSQKLEAKTRKADQLSLEEKRRNLKELVEAKKQQLLIK